MIVVFALILKPIAWLAAFRLGTRGDMDATLLAAAGITVVLTLVDKVSVASNLKFSAIVLTLVLYTLMSFTLIPLAWKVKKRAPSLALNLLGTLGAFAGVNFTMDLVRGFIPSMKM